MAAPPRFESLPPEIRNIVYSYLLPPARLKRIWRYPTSFLNPLYWACVLHAANTSILLTNRNINREASAVLYRDVLLVSIDWKTNSRVYLDLILISHHITFNFVPRGAPLPPYVIRIQQQDHDGNSSGVRRSMVFAAADFPAISRLLLEPSLDLRNHIDETRTSFSVVSLPKTGYNVDRLREMIWSPLLAIREGPLGNGGGRTLRSLRLIDCTGVFEQTSTELDRDSNLDDGDDVNQEDKSGESDSGKYVSELDTRGNEDIGGRDFGEEDIDEGNIEQEDSDEDNSNESNGNGDSDDNGSIDEEDGITHNEEHNGAETTTKEHHQGKDPEAIISNSASSTPDRDGAKNAHTVVEDQSVAAGRSSDKFFS